MTATGQGLGVVGLGEAGAPAERWKLHDKCGSYDHPGTTYNPWHDTTWCLCGEATYPGDQITHPHVACCGGPLEHNTKDAA